MTLPRTSYFEPPDDVVLCSGCDAEGPAELAVEVPGHEGDAWYCPGCALRYLPADSIPLPCQSCPGRGSCHEEVAT